MKTNRRESQVLAGILAYLDTRTDFYYWRANTGASHFGTAFVKFGVRGIADIIGLQATWRTTPWCGRFVAIEVKRESGGKQSVEQKRFQENVINHGGVYILARTIDDVVFDLGGPPAFRIPKVGAQRLVPR